MSQQSPVKQEVQNVEQTEQKPEEQKENPTSEIKEEQKDNNIKSQMKRDFFKMHCAIFFGYNGKGYHGLQHQKDSELPTIEKMLFKGLQDSDLLFEKNYGELQKNGWSRGARTDKGVHALTNGVNLKICIRNQYVNSEENKGEDEQEKVENFKDEVRNKSRKDIKNNINFQKILSVLQSNIPNDIQMIGIKKVTNNFCIRKNTASRLYEYVIPLFCFQKKDDFLQGKEINEEEEYWIQTRVKELVQKFKGTKNYHNYTTKMKANDPKAKRYILKMQADIVPNSPKEFKFIRILLQGQSFIYHQIRKILGIIAKSMQEELTEEFIENSFFQNHVKFWLAPAEGLFLNTMIFDGYNKKAQLPELLVYNEQEEVRREELRQNLLQDIFKSEVSNKVFTNWLRKMHEEPDFIEEEGPGGEFD